jgi:hypothetical protein
MPKSVVACVGGWLFCRNYEFPQRFHFFVSHFATFCFSRFNFSVRNFQLIVLNFHFIFCAKLCKFLLADSDFHASAFQFPIFQFSADKNPTFTLLLFRFQFSSFCWQIQFSRFYFFSLC